MSHFSVVVIVKEDKRSNSLRANLQLKASQLLEPFNEHTQVAPYEKDCWCKGREAKRAIENISNGKFGEWNIVREKFRNDNVELLASVEDARLKIVNLGSSFPADENHPFVKAYNKLQEQVDELWNTKYSGPKMEFEKTELEKHPDNKKPLDTCEDCNGTGTYQSTYNPNSQWDYHSLGGGWNGDLPGKRNIAPVKEIGGYRPFAFLTPKGEWIERGKMGWWGITIDEKSADEWETACAKVINKYSKEGYYALLYDCHI